MMSCRVERPSEVTTNPFSEKVLRHARAYNLSKARFHGLIKINCDGRRYPDTIIVKAAVEIPEPVFVFDYALPGELVKGKVIVTADSLGQIITLHVPSQGEVAIFGK